MVADTVLAYRGDRGVELQCPVEANPQPKFEWYLEGSLLTNSLDYRVYDNGSLLIVVMLPHLAGRYVCIARNILGTSASTVRLEYAGIAITLQSNTMTT